MIDAESAMAQEGGDVSSVARFADHEPGQMRQPCSGLYTVRLAENAHGGTSI